MNKMELIGRLTTDPEERYTAENKSLYVTFGLAVSRRYVSPDGTRQSDFINCVAWGKCAEFCSKYFKKGQQVGLVGRFQSRNWEDKQGNKRTTIEMIIEEADFADSKKDSGMDSSNFEDTFGTNVSDNTEFKVESSDDDLPF